MKVFLIGYMGSGKTTIGKALATQLKVSFVDLDDLIVANAGHPISEIFEGKGEETFRKMEKSALRSLKNTSDAIIACGGGTPCFYDNMDWMKSNGLTVYLKNTPTQIIQNLGNQIDHRPLLQGKSKKELLEYIEVHLNKRASFYEQAKVEVSCRGDLEKTIKELRAFMYRFI